MHNPVEGVKVVVKVLVISTVPFAQDGITNVIMNHFRYIDEGVHMDFVFLNEPSEDALREFSKKDSKVNVTANRTKNFFLYWKQLNLILKTNNFDVVHIHGNSSTMIIELLAAKINKIPKRFVHVHAKYTKYPLLNKVLNPVFKRMYTKAIAPSMEAGDYLFGENKYEIIKNGIPVDDYAFTLIKRESVRAEFNFNDEDIVIGSIGRLADEKNQKYLLDLLKNLDDFKYKLLLVGEGPLDTSLKKITQEYGLENQVVFAGVRNDVTELLSGMDTLVIPSLSEGLGITAIEAQAAELPVFISENVPGDVFQTPLAFSFKLDNMDTLISEIKKVKNCTCNRNLNKNNNDMKESTYNIYNSTNELFKLYVNDGR